MHSFFSIKLTTQERIFDSIIIISMILYVIALFSIFNSTKKYYTTLDYIIKLYIASILIWRFNPMRSHAATCSTLDRKIVFTSAISLLTTTFINQFILLN